MSEHDQHIHDPVIDTIQESDNENDDAVSSTPIAVQVERADSAQDIEAYNGDSLAGTGSPFKKSYSGSSLEASVDSLVDEPLPIVSDALSPFRMDSIHNSPLPTRQKDPHTFSVSVSDSLPPHVMELDSPEHYGDRLDEPDDDAFCVDKVTPVKLSAEFEEFFIGAKSGLSGAEGATSNPLPEIYHGVMDRILPSLDGQKQKERAFEESRSFSSKKVSLSQMDTQLVDAYSNLSTSNVPLSQHDMFDSESQCIEEKEDSPVFQASDSIRNPPDLSLRPDPLSSRLQEDLKERGVNRGSVERASYNLSQEEDLLQESNTPHTDAQNQEVDSCVVDDPYSASPVKRKRESSDESKDGLDSKVLKKDRDGEADSDIEILESSQCANQSIEVVYDKKVDTEPIESQDLNLILTGINTQAGFYSQSPLRAGGHVGRRSGESSQSQSLLSMPDSVRLTCPDTLSSSEDSAPFDGTIRATQVELLCPPPPALLQGQPNIETLVQLPIVGKDSSYRNSISSNFNPPSTNSPKSCRVVEAGDSLPPLYSPESESQESTGKVSVTYPHFDTPSDLTPEEVSESVFVKAARAATERLKAEEEDKKARVEEVECVGESRFEKDSFDASMPDPSGESQSKAGAADSLAFSLNDSDRKGRLAKDSPLAGHDAIQCASDSNQSTPLSAMMNLTRSHQSTPISSQRIPEASTLRLFPQASQEHNDSSDRDASQKSQVFAEDSDEESGANNMSGSKRVRHSSSSQSAGGKPDPKKTSTPNLSSNSISPNISKEVGSYIDKDSHLNSTLGSNLGRHSNNNSAHSDAGKADTLDMESSSVHCVKDIVESGWTRVGVKKLSLECWMSPMTKEIVFSILGEEVVVKEGTTFGSVVSFTPTSLCYNSSSSSKDSRISDVSSISRVTSLSGYMADKSSLSSFEPPLESTRHSCSSVLNPPLLLSPTHSTTSPPLFPAPIPLPHSNHLAKADNNNSDVSEFLPPHPKRPPLRINRETQTDSTSTSDESYVPTKPKRSRGRGRPRGRGKGRGRGTEMRDLNIPTPIKEDPPPESKETEEKPEKGDDFLSLLPEFLQERLQEAQIPLTEDEEELFLLQKAQTDPDDQRRQYEEILRKVRMAEIRPNTLVFARYLDKNYYSALVLRWVKEDKWEVRYNPDGCENCVREMYIMPTEILPKGMKCHVRNPKTEFSDPGMIKGHLYQNDTLVHLVEIHKGHVVRAPHSHIILSPEVADEVMKPRLGFHSMIASPGVDVSLNNIVAGKRRRETSFSPQRRIHSAFEPRPNKPDSNLDTSDGGDLAPAPPRTPKGSYRKVPTTFSEDTNSDSAPLPSPSSSKKSPRKLLPKSPPKPRTPSSMETPQSKSTGKTPKVSTRTPRTPQGSTRTPRMLKDSTLTPKTRRDAPPSPPPSPSPSPSKCSKKSLLGGERGREALMNPRVELTLLPEVSESPKSTPKKRGRRPGGGAKHPKKTLRVASESPEREDQPREVDPRLGPLPKKGCKIFEGYSILITHAGNNATAVSYNEDDQDILDVPFLDREHLREQILLCSGRVLDNFDEAASLHGSTLQSRRTPAVRDDLNVMNLHTRNLLPAAESPSKVLCVSNSFCRTAKFIQCLTVGIPLVSTQWVISSIQMNSCLNWLQYLLPAGLSLLTGNLMEQTFKDPLKDTSNSVGKVVEVLKGEKVFLATSSNPSFGELWLHLLNAADAAVFKMPPKGGNIQRLIDRRTSVVIADSSIPEDELKRARQVNIPIVSSEWFIQSLIARCKLQYDAHPDFNYTHKMCKGTTAGADEEKGGDR